MTTLKTETENNPMITSKHEELAYIMARVTLEIERYQKDIDYYSTEKETASGCWLKTVDKGLEKLDKLSKAATRRLAKLSDNISTYV